jgi:ubiquinone/menaquinone biosynthesis C-methylase UbiE
VNARDAVALLRPAIPSPGEVWADLGAGDGTFTWALAELLGPEGRVYAVDRSPGKIEALRRRVAAAPAEVIPVVADFTGPFELPALGRSGLDGLLMANALHYVEAAGVVLARLVERLRPGGRLVLVEYDRRRPSPWVPYPIPEARLPELTAAAGLSRPTVLSTRPSAFGGTMYMATAVRPGV